ncbi:MAG: hypothetical protein ABW185_22530 [Sedimenticola sp.]
MAQKCIGDVEEATRQLVLMPERGLVRRMMMDQDVSADRKIRCLTTPGETR